MKNNKEKTCPERSRRVLVATYTKGEEIIHPEKQQWPRYKTKTVHEAVFGCRFCHLIALVANG